MRGLARFFLSCNKLSIRPSGLYKQSRIFRNSVPLLLTLTLHSQSFSWCTLDHSAPGKWTDSPNKPIWRGLFMGLPSLAKETHSTQMCLRNRRGVWHCDKLGYPESCRIDTFLQKLDYREHMLSVWETSVEAQSTAQLLAGLRDTRIFYNWVTSFTGNSLLDHMITNEPVHEGAHYSRLTLKLLPAVQS